MRGQGARACEREYSRPTFRVSSGKKDSRAATSPIPPETQSTAVAFAASLRRVPSSCPARSFLPGISEVTLLRFEETTRAPPHATAVAPTIVNRNA